MQQTLHNTATRADSIATTGELIYESMIKQHVESEHRGDYLVIDIGSGDYAIAPTEESALEQIEARQPHGVFYLLQIGYKASLFMGNLQK